MRISPCLLSVVPLFLIALLLEVEEIAAFTTSPTRIRGVPTTSASRSVQVPSSLPAKKRRRRRKDAPDSSSSSSSSDTDDPISPAPDELPDFDLGDDGDSSSKAAMMNKKKDPTPAPASSSSDPMGEISSAMMGTANQPVRSVNQLIADRSLEKNFEFDEPEGGDDVLPDLAVLAKQQEAGRKRAKRDARVAAAVERKGQEEEDANPLSKIPFFVDDNGEVSAIKVRIRVCFFLLINCA